MKIAKEKRRKTDQDICEVLKKVYVAETLRKKIQKYIIHNQKTCGKKLKKRRNLEPEQENILEI